MIYTAQELAAYPVLSAEEEQQLAERARAGDRKARDHLVACNIRLVLAVAKGYLGLDASQEDLIQEGCIALLYAIKGFDPERGRFSTYALPWIRQALDRASLAHRFAVPLPAWTAPILAAVRRELEHQDTTMVDPSAIAARLGCATEPVEGVLRWLKPAHSLDQPPGDEANDDVTYADFIVASDQTADPLAQIEAQERIIWIERNLAFLPQRQRTVLEMYYGLGPYRERPRNYAEIGQAFQVSRQRARNIGQQALCTLREAFSYEQETLERSV